MGWELGLGLGLGEAERAATQLHIERGLVEERHHDGPR